MYPGPLCINDGSRQHEAAVGHGLGSVNIELPYSMTVYRSVSLTVDGCDGHSDQREVFGMF